VGEIVGKIAILIPNIFISHAFEAQFVKTMDDPILKKKWDHENLSCEILGLLHDRKNECMSTEGYDKVCNMIKGVIPEKTDTPFLYQIVHNSVCEIDADKFDYLQRDCHGARLPLGVDCDRIMKMSSIDDKGYINFPLKESYNLVQLFATRYALHKQIYSHPVVKAVELMIGDILVQNDKQLEITKNLAKEPSKESLAWYIGLTDSILNQIERSKDCDKTTLLRLRTRDLYRMVGEYVVPPEPLSQISKINPPEPVSQLPKFKAALPDFLVIELKRNWAQGPDNPRKTIFKDSEETIIDSLLPRNFQEVVVRVYTKMTTHSTLEIEQDVDAILTKEGLRPSPNNRNAKVLKRKLSDIPTSNAKRRLTMNDREPTASQATRPSDTADENSQ